MSRKVLLTLLLSLTAINVQGSEVCINAPTTTCLLQLAEKDLDAIEDDEEAVLWQRRYRDLLQQDLLKDLERRGYDAVLQRLIAMSHTSLRDAAIEVVATRLAQDGDKRVVELVWEADDDQRRLDAILAACEAALDTGHSKLSRQLFDDALHLFSRLTSISPDPRLFRRMKQMARKYKDDVLLRDMVNQYRSAVVSTSRDVAQLREAGAYRESLQAAMEKEPGRDRLNAVVQISRDWMKAEGMEWVESEMQQTHPALFKSASMYAVGNHLLRAEKKPHQAMAFLERAESYADGVSSELEREGLYREIAEGYEEVSRKHDLDVTDRVMALSSRVKDKETILRLQMSLVVGPLDKKEYERARVIVERAQQPLPRVIYYYFMAEQAKEAGDSSSLLSYVQEGARYVDALEPVELRAEVWQEFGKSLRKANYLQEAKEMLLRAVDAATTLPAEKRYRLLEDVAKEFQRLGDESEAQRALQLAHHAVQQLTGSKERVDALLELAAGEGATAIADQLQADYHVLETTLTGAELAHFYLLRADQSAKQEQLQTALNYIAQALNQTMDKVALREVVRRGGKLFSTTARSVHLRSILQHPMIATDIRDEWISEYLSEEGKKAGDGRELLPLIELLSDEGQIAALVQLLSSSSSQSDRSKIDEIKRRLEKLVKRHPQLRSNLLDAMLAQPHQTLLKHYRAEIEEHISLLRTEGQKFYFQALLHYRDGVTGDEARAMVATQLQKVLTMQIGQEQHRTLLLYAMAIEGYEEPEKGRKRRR